MNDHEHERSAALQRLDALVGKWVVEMVFPGDELFKAQTQASFEWLDEDRCFLVYRAGTPGSGFPVGHCIIGADDMMDSYTMLYSDSRGVSRLYQMSLQDGVWRQWRDDPTFYQRFSAAFSEDRQTMTGSWEKSEDGTNWKHDFALTYSRAAD